MARTNPSEQWTYPTEKMIGDEVILFSRASLLILSVAAVGEAILAALSWIYLPIH
jgi:hypothetical protein